MALLHALSYAYFEKAEDDVNSFTKVLSLMIGQNIQSIHVKIYCTFLCNGLV